MMLKLPVPPRVTCNLPQNFMDKFASAEEVARYAKYLVSEKYLNPEVNSFTKKAQTWALFKLNDKTKDAVGKHLSTKMVAYKMGDVNRVKQDAK